MLNQEQPCLLEDGSQVLNFRIRADHCMVVSCRAYECVGVTGTHFPRYTTHTNTQGREHAIARASAKLPNHEERRLLPFAAEQIL